MHDIALEQSYSAKYEASSQPMRHFLETHTIRIMSTILVCLGRIMCDAVLDVALNFIRSTQVTIGCGSQTVHG